MSQLNAKHNESEDSYVVDHAKTFLQPEKSDMLSTYAREGTYSDPGRNLLNPEREERAESKIYYYLL
jgi:hypothetical protein